MSKLLVPAPVLSAEHHEPGGVYDLYGRELSHAAHAHAVHAIFAKHPALHYLAKRSAAHAEDPNHESHAELANAFSASIHGTWHIDRYDAPIEWYAIRAQRGAGAGAISKDEVDKFVYHHLDAHAREVADRAMKRDVRSYHTTEFEDSFINLFTTSGVSALWNQAANGGFANSGAAVPKLNAWYNNAQAVIGVGDSATAATNAQFDLQAATNRLWVAMDASFPTLPASGSNQIVFRSTYGSTNANYSWQEFGVANDNGSNISFPASTARVAPSGANNGNLLDRVVSNQGTKASGQTWQPSMTLSIS